MTQINFYLLPTDSPQRRLQWVCRLVNKAYKQGRHIYIHTESSAQAAQLDDLLWTFSQDSFIPHALSHQAGEFPPPVLLGYADEPSGKSDVLITLATNVPPFWSQFERVAELVDQQAEVKKYGRERYRFYTEQGCKPETHSL